MVANKDKTITISSSQHTIFDVQLVTYSVKHAGPPVIFAAEPKR